MKWERLAIILIVLVTLTVFLVPVVHMPKVPHAMTVDAPVGETSTWITVSYLVLSGLLAGISPLLFLATLFMGGLLFIYNKSRIPRYSKYYLVGVFAMFFTFQFDMTVPGGIESSLFNFQVMMMMAIVSILLALLAQEFSPGFAQRAAKNETVKITFFIFVGALVALIILMYGDGSASPVVGFAATSGHSTISLMVYNLFALLPSFIIFTVLSSVGFHLHTRWSNDKETIMIIGIVILFVVMLAIEVVTILTGQ